MDIKKEILNKISEQSNTMVISLEHFDIKSPDALNLIKKIAKDLNDNVNKFKQIYENTEEK